jgi:spore coat polysaccharide biosynthesis protein SpsF
MRENKKIACIIQARMGSTRLPKKSMMPLGGKPLLQNVFERVQLTELVDEIVLATTKKSEDDVLVELAESMGISIFRGHPTDLIDRYYHAAIEFKAEIIVRIPADNPLVEPTEIDRIINFFLNQKEIEFASNLGPFCNNGYPDGLGAEVFEISLLKRLLRINVSRHRQDTVPSYIFENPDEFNIGSVKCPKRFSRPDIILDINTKEQYNFIAKLFKDLSKPGELIHIEDIIPWYDSFTRKRD